MAAIYNALFKAPKALAMKPFIIHSQHIHNVGGKLQHMGQSVRNDPSAEHSLTSIPGNACLLPNDTKTEDKGRIHTANPSADRTAGFTSWTAVTRTLSDVGLQQGLVG